MNKLRLKPFLEIYSVKIFCILVKCMISLPLNSIIYSFLVDIERVKKQLRASFVKHFSSLQSKRLSQLVYTENRFIQVFKLSYSGETYFVTVSKSKINRFTRGCHFMLNLKCLLLIFILKTIFSSTSTSFNFSISLFFEKKRKFL